MPNSIKRFCALSLIAAMLLDASFATAQATSHSESLPIAFSAQALSQSAIFSREGSLSHQHDERSDVLIKKEGGEQLILARGMSFESWLMGMKASSIIAAASFMVAILTREFYELTFHSKPEIVNSLMAIPIPGIILLGFVPVMMKTLLGLGQFYRLQTFWKEPTVPKRLFGFSHIRLEDVEFVNEEGRSLLIHPDLAASLDPEIAPWWLRLGARVVLGAIGASGHEALHSLGLQGERKTWFFMQYLIPTIGFIMGVYIINLEVGPSYYLDIAGGLFGTALFTFLVSFGVAALASRTTFRLKLFAQLLKLHAWNPSSPFLKFLAQKVDVQSSTILELIQNDPSLFRMLKNISTMKLKDPDAIKLAQMQSDGEIFKDLEGLPLSGLNNKESYKLHMRFDPVEKSWELEFFLDSPGGATLFGKGKIGSVKLYYNPTVNPHMLIISHLQFDANHQQEGLYREALNKIANNLPSMIYSIRAIIDPSKMSQTQEIHDTREWKALAQILSNRGLNLKRLDSSGPMLKPWIDCDLRTQEVDMQVLAPWPQDLKDAPWGLWIWWLQQAGSIIPNVDPMSPLAQDEIRIRHIEMHFWKTFMTLFKMQPRATIMEEVSRRLRSGNIDGLTLTTMFKELGDREDLMAKADLSRNTQPLEHAVLVKLRNMGRMETVRRQISVFNAKAFLGSSEMLTSLPLDRLYWFSQLVEIDHVSPQELLALFEDLDLMVHLQIQEWRNNKMPFQPFDLKAYVIDHIFAGGRYDPLFRRNPDAYLRLIGFLSNETMYHAKYFQAGSNLKVPDISKFSLALGHLIVSGELKNTLKFAANSHVSDIEFMRRIQVLYRPRHLFEYVISDDEGALLKLAINHLAGLAMLHAQPGPQGVRTAA